MGLRRGQSVTVLNDNGTIYMCNTVDEAASFIVTLYKQSNDVTSKDCTFDIGEMLNSIYIEGLSIEDVTMIYAIVYSELDSQKVYRINKYGTIDLASFIDINEKEE